MVQFKLKTGELVFRINSADNTYTAIWKPKAIDVESLVPTLMQCYVDTKNWDYSSVATWIQSYGDAITPVGKDADGAQLMEGFYGSFILTDVIALSAFFELNNKLYPDVNIGDIINKGIKYINCANIMNNLFSNAKATNLQLANLAGGDLTSNPTMLRTISLIKSDDAKYVTGYSLANPDSSGGSITVQRFVLALIYCWMLARIDRSVNPTDYTFVPYTTRTIGFSSASWSIKTDDDINKAFSKWVVAIAVIVVVATTAAIVIPKLVKLHRNRWWKKYEFINKMDNKLFEGESLSNAERRKYIRWSRKLNASSMLEAGSAVSSLSVDKDTSSVATMSNATASYQQENITAPISATVSSSATDTQEAVGQCLTNILTIKTLVK